MAEEFPSNSNKMKEAKLIREATKPTVEAPVVINGGDIPSNSVTSGVAEVHHPVAKRGEFTPVRAVFAAIFPASVREVAAAIFPGGFKEIKEHVIWDVFVPWAQDALHSGWDAVGDVLVPGSNPNAARRNIPEHVSYENHYRQSYSYTPPISYSLNNSDGMRPVPKQEAEAKLYSLKDICRRYGYVTLLDFNDIVGNPTYATQRGYGWINLDSADIAPVRGGWIIRMPHAVPIES